MGSGCMSLMGSIVLLSSFDILRSFITFFISSSAASGLFKIVRPALGESISWIKAKNEKGKQAVVANSTDNVLENKECGKTAGCEDDEMNDSDWEDCPIPTLHNTSDAHADDTTELTIQFDDLPDTKKQKNAYRATAKDKELAELVHKLGALVVALFRALNLTTRFVSILDVASLKPGADKDESSGQKTQNTIDQVITKENVGRFYWSFYYYYDFCISASTYNESFPLADMSQRGALKFRHFLNQFILTNLVASTRKEITLQFAWKEVTLQFAWIVHVYNSSFWWLLC